jgi:uncharacterized membrane protein
MPYCVNCGTGVGLSDTFCAVCGARQNAAATADFMSSLSPRTLSILCYIPLLGWIACVLVLASQRFREDRAIRFHAFQGLYLFVIWLLIDWVISPLVFFGPGRVEHLIENVLTLLIYAAWIVMLVKTSQQQHFSLPIVGELAERSVAEQR